MFIGDSKSSFLVSLRRVRRVDGGGREKTFSFYNTTFAKGAQMYYLCNRHKGKTVIIDRFALVFFIKKRCFCKRMPYFFLALDGENPSLGVSPSGGDVVEKDSRIVKLSYKLFLTHKPSYDSSLSLQAVGWLDNLLLQSLFDGLIDGFATQSLGDDVAVGINE